MKKQDTQMKWILFWVFIIIFVLVTLLTILALFFGLGNLSEEFHKPLFTTFIIETGIGIITLFFSLFGLRKRSYSKVKGSSIETELINDVDIVKDSPLGTDIPLNIQVDLLGSYNGEINSLISSTDFLKQFNPSMMVFASSDNDYTEFRPNVVIQLENNPLINLNMTLSDYMDSAYSLTQEMQNIVGKRQVRIGSNMATQWFRINLSNLLGNEVKTDITYTQFQKIVITDDLMGIITISYGDETKPNDIKILQDFLNKFGIK